MRPGRDPLAADAGGYALTEAELQDALQAAAADGSLRCSRCGVVLQPAQARLVRRRLAHRWATLPVCAACAPAQAPPTGPEAATDPGPASASGVVVARLGRFLGRAPLAAVVLEADPPSLAAGQARLGLEDGPPAGDFDPDIGPTVRALHQQYGDVPVRLPTGFGARLTWHDGGLRLCLHGPAGSWHIAAAAADLPALREARSAARYALVLLRADEPLAALLCPAADLVLPSTNQPPGA